MDGKLLTSIISTLLAIGLIVHPIKSQYGSYSRFMGGMQTKWENYPYFVSVHSSGVPVVSGAIIADQYVLTDIGNWHKPNDLYVAARGNITKNVIDIIRLNVTNQDNLAILKLESPFDLNGNISAIELADEETPEETNCTFIGTGYEFTPENEILHYTYVPIADISSCEDLYGGRLNIPDNILCSGGNGLDPCSPDIGSPLVCNGYLAGIVYVPYCFYVYPGLNWDVYQLRGWIEEHVNV